MKKISKILITLLIIIAVSALGLFVWQYDNISALISGLNSSSEDLAVKMDDHRNKVKQEVEKYVSKPIMDITSEDEEKLLKGEITVEEVAEKYNLPLEYMKDKDEAKDNKSEIKYTAPIKETPPAAPDTSAVDEVISSSVGKMYALKAKYVNKLGELERAVVEEYKNLPKSKQNEDGKYNLVMKNIDYVAELEEKCDKEVSSVLTSLKLELEKFNGDKEIIKILQNAYTKEKEVKKAYYLSLYKN